MLKKIFCSIALLCLIFNFGCAARGYSNDVSCKTLARTVYETSSVEYLEYGKEYTRLFLDDDAICDDFCILYSSEVDDINEVGFFHAPDEAAAKEICEELEEYLDERQEDERAFIASYAPNELTKLDGAQVKRFGNYVVYAILDADGRTQILDAVEKTLKEK